MGKVWAKWGYGKWIEKKNYLYKLYIWYIMPYMEFTVE
jgi:hypothetical protein